MSKNSKNKGRSWAGLLLLTVLCIVPVSPAETLGADLFTVNVVIGQGTAYMDREVRGFSRAEDVMRFAESRPLNDIFPAYDDSLAVVGDIDFRGLDMHAQFEKDSTVLHFQVESLNIDKSFMGATRDDSVDELVDFLEKDWANILDRIIKNLRAFLRWTRLPAIQTACNRHCSTALSMTEASLPTGRLFKTRGAHTVRPI